MEGLHWIHGATGAHHPGSLVKEGTGAALLVRSAGPGRGHERSVSRSDSGLIACSRIPLLAYKRETPSAPGAAGGPPRKKLAVIVEATQRPKWAFRGRRWTRSDLTRGARDSQARRWRGDFITEITEISFEFRRNPETLAVEEALDVVLHRAHQCEAGMVHCGRDGCWSLQGRLSFRSSTRPSAPMKSVAPVPNPAPRDHR